MTEKDVVSKDVKRKPSSFWLRLKRDYQNKHTKLDEKLTKTKSRHLTLDQLAAKRKFEQLKLLTTTDIAIANSAEAYRVSGFVLFKKNLLDPTLYVTISVIYILCLLLARESSNITFIILFSSLFFPINYHIESYRSFYLVRRNVALLTDDFSLRRAFLNTHLGFKPNQRIKIDCDTNCCKEGSPEITVDEPETIEEKKTDTFHWMNVIIRFFWPYLSHLVHYELNEFFREQIESGSLARSDVGVKRLFYALVRQLNTNILVIEKCQLGRQAPHIKNLTSYEGTSQTKIEEIDNTRKEAIRAGNKEFVRRSRVDSNQKLIMNHGKTLVFDINFEYNGDMDIAFIYKYFCCCSSRVGLKDIFLHFNMRLVIGPIKDNIPFIDQVSITLLELPNFGYKGIALAELAELKVVKRVINRMIRENILYPREVTIDLKDLLNSLLRGKPPTTFKDLSTLAKDSDNKGKDVSYFTKFTANALLCGCMCSNLILRTCQGTKSRSDSVSSHGSRRTKNCPCNSRKMCREGRGHRRAV